MANIIRARGGKVPAATVNQALTELNRKIEELAASIRLARGTRENVAPVKPFFVGDATDTEVLWDAVDRAIRSRGMTLQEISDETGARRNRISGVLVKMQKHGTKIINEGNSFRAVWRIK